MHDALDVLYTPFVSKVLSVAALESIYPKISAEITAQFIKSFKGGDFSVGKNLLIFEVAKKYVSNFIDFEIKEIKAGNEIIIKALEADLGITVEVPGLDFPVRVGGKVDRIDHYNGQMRIIDYKTGKVEQKDLVVSHWEKIRQEYSFSKAFQVLTYALIYNDTAPITQAFGGIISFKNLGSGFLKFTEKTDKKDTTITQETLVLFKEQLVALIQEICDISIDFQEKEV